MPTVDQISFEEAEKLAKEGSLQTLSLEEVPNVSKEAVDSYLGKRAEFLKADVIGVPENPDGVYGFYRTNILDSSEQLDPRFARRNKVA